VKVEVTESESQHSHSPVEGEWPVVVTPLLSSKKRPHFKTNKSLETTKIWSWVPPGPEIKNVLTRTRSNLLDWNSGRCWTPTILCLLRSLQENDRLVHRLRHYHFLSNELQVNIHYSSYHSMLYIYSRNWERPEIIQETLHPHFR
jgi:hypothetical protein